MKTMKAILFTIAIMMSVYAGAVEYGQYRPVYSTAVNAQTTSEAPIMDFNSTSPIIHSRINNSYEALNGGASINGNSDGSTASRGPRRGYGPEDEDDGTIDGIVVGSTKTEGGKVYVWTKTGAGTAEWVYVKDITEVNEPIGDAPILLLILLLGGYAAVAAWRRREEAA